MKVVELWWRRERVRRSGWGGGWGFLSSEKVTDVRDDGRRLRAWGRCGRGAREGTTASSTRGPIFSAPSIKEANKSQLRGLSNVAIRRESSSRELDFSMPLVSLLKGTQMINRPCHEIFKVVPVKIDLSTHWVNLETARPFPTQPMAVYGQERQAQRCSSGIGVRNHAT